MHLISLGLVLNFSVSTTRSSARPIALTTTGLYNQSEVFDNDTSLMMQLLPDNRTIPIMLKVHCTALALATATLSYKFHVFLYKVYVVVCQTLQWRVLTLQR